MNNPDSARALVVLLWLASAFVAIVTLTGCAYVESVVNACDTGRWRGWEAQATCERLAMEKRR